MRLEEISFPCQMFWVIPQTGLFCSLHVDGCARSRQRPPPRERLVASQRTAPLTMQCNQTDTQGMEGYTSGREGSEGAAEKVAGGDVVRYPAARAAPAAAGSQGRVERHAARRALAQGQGRLPLHSSCSARGSCTASGSSAVTSPAAASTSVRAPTPSSK